MDRDRPSDYVWITPYNYYDVSGSMDGRNLLNLKPAALILSEQHVFRQTHQVARPNSRSLQALIQWKKQHIFLQAHNIPLIYQGMHIC